MRSIGGCIVTEEQLSQWTQEFVPEYAPFFSADAELADALLHMGLIVYTKVEFYDAHMTFGLDYGAVFNIWGMTPHSDVSVCCLSDVELAALPDGLRGQLFKEQRRLKRGHVYTIDEAVAYIGDHGFAAVKEYATWTFEDGGMEHLVLTYGTWASLPLPIREAWTIVWVSAWLDEDGEALDFTPPPELSASAARFIRSHANHFPLHNGANCFAAAVAPLIASASFAEYVVEQWLHEGPLLRLLGGMNITQVDTVHTLAESSHKIQPEDVLIWRDAEGRAIHGAFAIDASTVFNKMGQSWAQPWRVLPLESVADYNGVLSGGGTIEVYRRGK